jgi:hypothetical protein
MDFRSFLFVRTSYKATFLNRSSNTRRHLRLHILSPFPPSSALPATYFPCRSTAQTCQPTQSRACLRRQHAFTWDRLLEDSPRVLSSLPDRVCVFTAAWLHIPDISFFAIHMGPSFVTFSTRFVVSAPWRVCVFLCLLSPAWLHLPDISISALATHSFSHFCTLSNTHFCSCLPCRYYDVSLPYIRK